MQHTKKILASLAIVGTIATIALFSTSESVQEGTFLAKSNNAAALKQFSDWASKHNKNYLTKGELTAR